MIAEKKETAVITDDQPGTDLSIIKLRIIIALENKKAKTEATTPILLAIRKGSMEYENVIRLTSSIIRNGL